MSEDGDPTPEEVDGSTVEDSEATVETDAAGAEDGNAGADGTESEDEAVDSGSDDRDPAADLVDVDDLLDRAADHDEELAEDVAAVVDERDELAARVVDLEAELADREQEVEDLESKLKRKQADFQNYKKRRKREEEKLRERATEDLVERLLDVRDNLVRALEDDHDDVEGLREGVKMTLNEFDRVLDAEEVQEIDPNPGQEVDPNRHEVMMRVDSDQPRGTIADVYQPGYGMADRVIRPAKVTVSEGDGSDAETDEEATPVNDEETAEADDGDD